MAVASWSIPTIPRAGPPARGVLLGSAFLTAARPPLAWRCRATTPRRVWLDGGVVVSCAGAAETPAVLGEVSLAPIPNGKAWVRVDMEPDGEGKCKVVIGCDVEGKWVLHWGVSYDGEHGREWDQPLSNTRPPGSVSIKVVLIL